VARDTITFIEPTIPSILSVTTAEPSVCSPSSGSITLETLGDSLEYSMDGGQSFQASPEFSNLEAGTYDLVIREVAHPNCVITEQVTLQLAEGLTIGNIDILNPSGCGTSDGALTINTSGEGLEFSIDGGESFQQSATFGGLSQGTYPIVVRLQDNISCVSVDTVALEAPGGPVITSLDIVNPSDCGQVRGSITVNAAGENLEYSIDGGVSFQISPVFSNLLDEFFEVVVRDAINPTCVAKDSVYFNVLIAPQVSSIRTTDPTSCGSNDGEITIFAVGGGLSYSIDGGINFQASNIFKGLSGGSYELVVKQENNPLCVATNRITLNAPLAPEITSINTNNPTGCGKSDGTIAVVATGEGLEYSIDGGTTFQANNIFTSLAAGSYQIVVRDNKEEPCISTEITNLKAPEAPTINELTVKDPQCGTGDGAITVLATGQNLEYSIDEGVTYQITNQFTGLVSGSYKVTVREVNTTGCEVSDMAVLSASDIPTIQSITSTDVSNCDANDGEITVVASGQNLEYSLDGGTTYQQSNLFQNLAAGNYYVFVREASAPDCVSSNSSAVAEPEGCDDLGQGQLDVTVKPNPFMGSFTLEILGKLAEDASIQVSNPLGQVLYQRDLNGDNTMEMGEEFTEGIYWITLRSGLHVEIVKVVKHKE